MERNGNGNSAVKQILQLFDGVSSRKTWSSWSVTFFIAYIQTIYQLNNCVFMKKAFFYFYRTFLILGLLCLCISCTSNNEPNDDDNPKTTVTDDPEGTVAVKMRNSDYGGTKVIPIGCFDPFYLDERNNLTYSQWGYSYRYKFASVGKVNGLKDINNIPIDGWSGGIPIEPGCGYVALYGNGVLTRIYVEKWIEGIGGVIGAEIKYQGPFEP